MISRRLTFGSGLLVTVAALLVTWALGREPGPGEAEGVARESADPVRPPLLGGTGAAAGSEGSEEEEAAAAEHASDPVDDESPVAYEAVARALHSGEPIPHLAVRFETSERSGLGTLHVVADAAGRLTIPVSSVTAVESETEGWTAMPFRATDVAVRGVLTFHAWFEIDGRVEWDGGDAPDLSEVTVRVSGRNRKAVVEGPEAGGRFRIRLPLVREVRVTAHHPDAWPAEAKPETPAVPDRTVGARLVLRPRARPILEGRVVDGAGRPMAGVILHAHVRAKGIPADPGYFAWVRSAEGRRRPVRLETPFLPATGHRSVSGRLPHRWLSASTRSDVEGRFRFSLPAPGPLEVTAFAAGHAPVRLDPVEVPAAGAEVELRVHRPVGNAAPLSFTRAGVRVAPAHVWAYELVGAWARHGLSFAIEEDTASAVDTTWLEPGRRYRFEVEHAEAASTVVVEWANQTEIALTAAGG